MKLSQLFPFAVVGSDPDVTGVAQDSRKVRPGDVFFAFKGFAQDGHAHIQDAVSRGAVAVVCEHAPQHMSVPCLQVAHPRRVLQEAAAFLYGSPLDGMVCVGVTGTNGKTTTAHLVESVVLAAGKCTGIVGTLGIRYADVVLPGMLTTPDVCTLMPVYAAMRARGVETVVMEASSHALHQGRLDAVDFDVAVYTHLTQDHLDYHGTMDAYYEAKKILFTERLKKQGHAVVNTDDRYGRMLAQEHNAQWTYSCAGDAQAYVKASDIVADAAGVRMTVRWGAHSCVLRSPLKGAFNAENILAAYCVGLALGVEPEVVARGIASLHAVPGRMEAVSEKPLVLVDYAHTPDALEKALKASRSLGSGRVFSVFGCGGNRDVLKRPKMGYASLQEADWTVVTSDNPRDEEPLHILKQVVEGMEHAVASAVPCAKGVHVEPDRALAIRHAVMHASDEDTVLVAGKGHETYQEARGVRVHFDDRVVAREVLYASVPWEMLAEAAGACVHHPVQPASGRVSAWCSDTRSILPEALFVALRGGRFDGHAFVRTALAKGAWGAVVDEEGFAALKDVEAPLWVVKNTLHAWGEMARVVRGQIGKPVVGVTGSNGKTTTKELIAACLGVRGRVHKTHGNLNNEVGMPRTVFDWPLRAWCAVVEMGMNAPGEIRRMAGYAQSDVALITCVAAAHLEGLGSLEGVAHAKGELFEMLKPGGVAVVNDDDSMVKGVCVSKLSGQRVLRFGSSNAVDFKAEGYVFESSGVRFVLHTPSGSVPVFLPLWGSHHVQNALGAAACAYALGLTPLEIAEGLKQVRVPGGRQRVVENTHLGVHVIDDTYNANPGSMKAGLKSLKEAARGARTWALLGEMFELGPTSSDLHREVGEYAGSVQIDHVCAVGSHAELLVQGARGQGAQGMAYASVENMVLDVLPMLNKGDWILVKGSRGMRMERVVEALLQKERA